MTVRMCWDGLKKAEKRLKGITAQGDDPVSLWLCDNRYLLMAYGQEARRGLKGLKKLPGKGERMLSFVRDFVETAGGRADDKTLLAFLRQRREESDRLSAGEFDAFSLCLTGQLVQYALRDTATAEEVAAAVGSLREGGISEEVLFSACPVDRELHKDKTGAYPHSDSGSRGVLRKRVAKLAKKRGQTQRETAEELVSSGGLYGETRGDYSLAGVIRQVLLIAVTLGAAFVLWQVTDSLPLTAVTLLPLYALFLPVADTLTLRWVPTSRLLRLDPEEGIPEGGETAVAVSCLLTSPGEVKEVFGRLRCFFHADPDPRLQFGLIADLPDSDRDSMPGDRAVIAAALREWEALNEDHPDRFFLFLRKRRENGDGRFTGEERKRGALLSFMAFLRGKEESGLTVRGDREALSACHYVLTLDSDTVLSVKAATELVCIACHPENRPVTVDGRVVAGHGILVPRVVTSLRAGDKTLFAGGMTGVAGATAYTGEVGDLYQDLYGTGLFAGKGLIHVDTALAVLPDRLPKGRILSHDIPEGCLMRAGVAGDVELTDSCPATSKGYLKRLHRWTRGDVQNLCLLKEPAFDGLSKEKLLQNMRRAVTPILSFGLLILSPFLSLSAGAAVFSVGFASLIADDLWTVAVGLCKRWLARRPLAGASPTLCAVKRGGLRLLLAAETGLVLLSATVKALWRSTVSKKRLMEWVPASRTDKGGLTGVGGAAIGGLLTAVLLVLPVQNRLVLPFGLLWLTAPLWLRVLDKPRKETAHPLSYEGQQELREYAASMWRFFEDTLTEERGFLPPDNLQIFPVGDVAERTSPTNMGLMLLSAVAARDLSLIDTKILTDLLIRAVDTLETLPKERGNLYNWYDLKTKEVLSPVYLSSVDSGNFLCCLMALSEGMKDYLREDRRLWDLIPRVERLIDQTDLSVFADRRRGKLCIGLDGTGTPSTSAYDLLMSEALLTVTAGITRGQLPLRVYRTLGRFCGKLGNQTGALSWTGTMFEYFMPTLLLPVHKGSLLHHSLRYCLTCQKQRVKGTKLPWGISESGFYGFDPTLHYKYRAHGVQKAALCPGQNRDLVVAPYATFLTLTLDPEGALANLRRLKKWGMLGEYGFYEALDATPSRTGGEAVPVQSFMAHHVGMSLVAVANCLTNDRFVKRFTRRPSVQAGLPLLQEKLPEAVPVFPGADGKRDRRPPRQKLPVKEYGGITPLTPRADVLGSDGLRAVLFDTGEGYLSAETKETAIQVTARGNDPLQSPKGLFCLLKLKNRVLSVTEAPLYEGEKDGVSRQVKMAPGDVTYGMRGQGLEAALSVTVAGDRPAGCVRLTVKNLTAGRLTPTALLYAEPLLCLPGEETAHPAFARLFVTLKKYADGAVFLRRPGRGAPKRALAMVGGDGGVKTDRLFRRQELFRRPEGIGSLSEAFDSTAFRPAKDDCGTENGDLCAALRTQLSLPPRGQKTLCWFFALGKDGEEAMREARLARKSGFRALSLSAAAAKHNKTALSGMDSMAVAVLSQVLPSLLRPSWGREKNMSLPPCDDPVLWSMGLSGDLPLLPVFLSGRENKRVIKTFLSVHRYLSLNGIQADLVFAVKDRGEYGSPMSREVSTIAMEMGLEWELGRKGGVTSVDVSGAEGKAAVLVARAAYVGRQEGLTPPKEGPLYVPVPVLPVSLPGTAHTNSRGFTVDGTNRPRRPWCHVLANPAFGTLLSDCSVGHTWFLSSRENRLTGWANDPCTDLKDEGLFLDTGGKRYCLTKGAEVTFAEDTAVYRSVAGRLTVTVTVDVVKRLPAKQVTVAVTGSKNTPYALSYYTCPAPDRHGHPPVVTQEQREGVLLTRCLTGQLFPGVSFLCTKTGEGAFCHDKAAFLSGQNETKGVQPPYPAAAVTLSHVCDGDKRETVFFLGAAKSEEAAMRVVGILRKGEAGSLPSVYRGDPPQYRTGDRGLDRLLNVFLPKQIVEGRLMARTAFWQSSGACGFRDQLQDVCAAVTFAPLLARQHILRASCRQFEEGDVFHWWIDRGTRPPFGSRTTCSDDLLWLPYAVERYLSVTGDDGVLEVKTPFLVGELPEETGEKGMEARYGSKGTVMEHCLRALKRACRLGSHGLVRMGVCDWNDGLSNVGVRGKGETVWGTQFLSLCCRRFAPVCERKGQRQEADSLLSLADRLDTAWKAAFRKDRYLRAYDDRGNPMGQEGDKAMAIDLLPQSFAAILYPEEENSRIALETVQRELWDEKTGLIRLFAPAFDSTHLQEGRPSPGYVAAYPPGVRENGGQYTHGALWYLFALCRTGQKELARKLADGLRPDVMYGKDPLRYGGEPYYVAADVSGPPDKGKAGWTLYTGAAGWMYRLYTEELL